MAVGANKIKQGPSHIYPPNLFFSLKEKKRPCLRGVFVKRYLQFLRQFPKTVVIAEKTLYIRRKICGEWFDISISIKSGLISNGQRTKSWTVWRVPDTNKVG